VTQKLDDLVKSAKAQGMKVPEKLYGAELIEYCINQYKPRRETNGQVQLTRWAPLEEAILENQDPRLMCKYACNLRVRWSEAEKDIGKSDYLYNYLNDCMRSIPKHLFLHPEKLTTKRINDENNSEKKRILIDLMGVDKYLSLSNAKVIHTDSTKINGNRALIGTDDGRWLSCQCPSTGRVYFIGVPLDINTCKAADAWLGNNVKARQVGRT
jgi:hypothetical protein